MENSATTLVPCGYTRGVFLVTRCQRLSIAACSRCGLPICPDHSILLNQQAFCPNCRAGETHATYTGFSTHHHYSGHYGTSSRSSSLPADTDTSRNNDFDWGAASDEWSNNPDTSASADEVAAPFAEEDYAAFDQVSDYDHEADKERGYDS